MLVVFSCFQIFTAISLQYKFFTTSSRQGRLSCLFYIRQGRVSFVCLELCWRKGWNTRYMRQLGSMFAQYLTWWAWVCSSLHSASLQATSRAWVCSSPHTAGHLKSFSAFSFTLHPCRPAQEPWPSSLVKPGAPRHLKWAQLIGFSAVMNATVSAPRVIFVSAPCSYRVQKPLVRAKTICWRRYIKAPVCFLNARPTVLPS